MATETIYFVYSKFSPACGQIFPSLQAISKFAQVVPVNIDNPETRQRILGTKIQNVPTIIVKTPSKIDVFEGQNLLNFINKLMSLINTPPQQQPPQVGNGQTTLFNSPTTVQTIVSPQDLQPVVAPQQPQADSNLNATMNTRLQPSHLSITSPQEQRTAPILSNQIASNTATQQAAILQQQAVQSAQMMPPSQMMPQPQMITPTQPMPPQAQQTTMMPPPPQQMPPQGGMEPQITLLDDSIIQGGASAIISDTNGYTQDQIGVKPKSGATGNAKQAAEMMQMERDEAEKQFNRR